MYYKNKAPTSVKVITADWRSVDWEQANTCYNDAADLAEETALTSYRQQVLEKYPDAKVDKLQLPDRAKVRRKAGNKAIASSFIPRYKLDQFGIHVIAQIVAYLATLSIHNSHGEKLFGESQILKITKNLGSEYEGYEAEEYQEEYAVSGLEFVKAHFNTPYMMGVYRFLMLDSRSSYLTKQYSGDARSYCSLVPLIMSAFKRVHDIPYNAWKRDELHYVVNSELATAMLYDYDYSLSAEQILEIRDKGLVWQSGPNSGKSRNPLHTHTLYGLTGTEFEKIPELARVMLSQIWCAHPENRTKYMVLDCTSWDRIPPSLISPTLFIEPEYTSTQTDLPWLS